MGTVRQIILHACGCINQCCQQLKVNCLVLIKHNVVCISGTVLLLYESYFFIYIKSKNGRQLFIITLILLTDQQTRLVTNCISNMRFSRQISYINTRTHINQKINLSTGRLQSWIFLKDLQSWIMSEIYRKSTGLYFHIMATFFSRYLSNHSLVPRITDLQIFIQLTPNKLIIISIIYRLFNK